MKVAKRTYVSVLALLTAGLIVSCTNSNGEEAHTAVTENTNTAAIIVKDQEEFERAVGSAKPGDTITLALSLIHI